MIFFIAIVVVGFLSLVYVFYGFGSPSKGARVRVAGKEFSVQVADMPASRTKGLSGRVSLPENGGMFFDFNAYGDYGFWMRDMNFPIDIIWIKDDSIVGFSENVLPEPGKSIFSLTTYHPPKQVDKVLEINAGLVRKYGFKVGDGVFLDTR